MPSRSPTRSGLINGVDLAVTYDVSVNGRQLAVSALTLLPGATITAADLTEAVANMPVGASAIPDGICVLAPSLRMLIFYSPSGANRVRSLLLLYF